jgi:hypothetical protein
MSQEAKVMEFTGWFCLSSILFSPIVAFFVGYWIGKRGLPYRLVRVDDPERNRYAVED